MIWAYTNRYSNTNMISIHTNRHQSHENQRRQNEQLIKLNQLHARNYSEIVRRWKNSEYHDAKCIKCLICGRKFQEQKVKSTWKMGNRVGDLLKQVQVPFGGSTTERELNRRRKKIEERKNRFLYLYIY